MSSGSCWPASSCRAWSGFGIGSRRMMFAGLESGGTRSCSCWSSAFSRPWRRCYLLVAAEPTHGGTVDHRRRYESGAVQGTVWPQALGALVRGPGFSSCNNRGIHLGTALVATLGGGIPGRCGHWRCVALCTTGRAMGASHDRTALTTNVGQTFSFWSRSANFPNGGTIHVGLNRLARNAFCGVRLLSCSSASCGYRAAMSAERR